MHGWHIAAELLAWLLAIAWVAKYVEASRGIPRLPHLWDRRFDRQPEGNPSIAVIVPARNEAAKIAGCIQSLLAQDYVTVRIVAVDDRSEDGTGTVLDAVANTVPSGRLKVLHIHELPPEWLGKPHALAIGAQVAIDSFEPDYLLFTDADVDFAPEAIRRSLVAAVCSGADHFVTLPTTIARTSGEAMVLAFLQVTVMWAARSWRAADPKALRDAVGVGAFNLIRTSVYRRIGGFEALRMEVVEDLTLGRTIKRAGYRQCVAVSPGLVSLHWAEGIRGIVRGLTKNIFAVFDYKLSIVLLAAIALAALDSVAPVALLAIPEARLPALIAWSGVVGVYVLSSRVSRLSAWYAVSMPLAAMLVVYAMLRSAVVTLAHGGVTWRGTFYPLAELRRHRALRENGLQCGSAVRR